ncbi:DMT family transporter [Roseobacter sp.]|uniref:DMT family transporter n=1 Tax=Roseobacter sp. TaxID=1907202 RepID=UPI0025CEB1AD|nr:DMT family transporter [Roseobacter sp.]
MTQHAIIMTLAGIGIPLLAALNAALGQRIGSPAAAATVLFVVAFASCAMVMVMTGTGALSRLSLAPKHLFLGGVLVAFYVLSITWIAPVFGIGNAIFFVLLGQLISAGVIDHFGLFGARLSPMTGTRAFGIALMAAGVFFTQKVQAPPPVL